MILLEERVGDFYLFRRILPALTAILNAAVPALDLINETVFLSDLLGLLLFTLLLRLQRTHLPTQLLHLTPLTARPALIQ
jgi:hypothetical protein